MTRLTLRIFLPLFAAVLGWAFVFRVTDFSIISEPPKGALTWIAALAASALFAGGLAVFGALLIKNRGRWRAILRPTRGHVIGAVVMAILTPLTVFEGVPWIVLGLLFLPQAWLLIPVLALAWFPVSGLIVSGIHRRSVRVLVFALCWWCVYAGLLLAIGHQVFTL